MDSVAIAKVCHEANRAYCETLGDTSQVPWEDAPLWQKQSAISGVEFNLANPDAPPSASHDSWLAQKKADGWKYGPVKNPEAKEHPRFVPYEQLPLSQRLKDHLFKATVKALSATDETCTRCGAPTKLRKVNDGCELHFRSCTVCHTDLQIPVSG